MTFPVLTRKAVGTAAVAGTVGMASTGKTPWAIAAGAPEHLQRAWGALEVAAVSGGTGLLELGGVAALVATVGDAASRLRSGSNIVREEVVAEVAAGQTPEATAAAPRTIVDDFAAPTPAPTPRAIPGIAAKTTAAVSASEAQVASNASPRLLTKNIKAAYVAFDEGQFSKRMPPKAPANIAKTMRAWAGKDLERTKFAFKEIDGHATYAAVVATTPDSFDIRIWDANDRARASGNLQSGNAEFDWKAKA